MSERYRDFDAWEAERLSEPLRFKVRGKEFELSPSLPAIIPIKAMRMQSAAGGKQGAPPDAMMDLALSLFGEQQLEELLATGVDIDTLAEIVSWAIEQYTGAAPGNAAAAGGAARSTSSGTGG